MSVTPFHIAIDSNHLRRDRTFSKSDILFLKSLAKMKLIKLHMPWFIYKECISAFTNDILLELETVGNTLVNLTKKGLHINEASELDKICSSINTFKSKVATSVEGLWQNFIDETDTTLYQYDPLESTTVFENYFKGGPPFKSLKSRNDIPDAFIFLTITKISTRNYIHFITEDNNLREKLLTNVFVRTYKNYSDLFSSNMFQPIQRQYEQQLEYESSKQILLSNLDNISSQFMDFLIGAPPFAVPPTNILSDSSHTTIISLDNIKLNIPESDIKYVNDIFYVEVYATAFASVEFFIYKPDILNQEYATSKLIEWNDDYYLGQDRYKIGLKKTLKIAKEELKTGSFTHLKIDGLDEVIVDKNSVRNISANSAVEQ